MTWTKGDTRVVKQVLITLTIAALTMWLLSGCSATYHMKKAIAKDPTIIQNDTVYTTDTVWRVVEEVDTIIQLRHEYDTVYYRQDSVIIKAVKLPGDSVYIAADCPDCPEVTNTGTITKTITLTPSFLQGLFKYSWLIVVGAILTLAVIFKLLW